MASPVEIINDKITTESRNLDKKFLKFGIFALIIFLVILFIVFVCYKWRYPFFELDCFMIVPPERDLNSIILLTQKDGDSLVISLEG